MSKNEEQMAILKDKQGRNVALKGVNVRARLHGLMAEVEVEQIYQNPHRTNIEAVYTFPLPIGAVLLGLDVEIAGRKISGHVVEKKQAERDYEDAVTDGNSAVMLEEADMITALFLAKNGWPEGIWIEEERVPRNSILKTKVLNVFPTWKLPLVPVDALPSLFSLVQNRGEFLPFSKEDQQIVDTESVGEVPSF